MIKVRFGNTLAWSLGPREHLVRGNRKAGHDLGALILEGTMFPFT